MPAPLSNKGTNMQSTFETFDEAIIAAHRHAKSVACGYAYAVQWPLGHCTVEYRKPSLRDQRMKVIECDAEGRELIA